jgi:hypothetical protein
VGVEISGAWPLLVTGFHCAADPAASENSSNTLLLAHDIAPPTASYAWLVNGPSSYSSQPSTARSDALNPTSGDHSHHSTAASMSVDRPRTSPMPQPVPSALAQLHSASASDLHNRLHTAPGNFEGASEPLLGQGVDARTQDGNPVEIVRHGRGGAAGELGITPRTRSKGSYWRRGAPLKSSHRGLAVQPGSNGGSSRGSSPGDYLSRSVSPPLPEKVQPSFVSRQFPTSSTDQSLMAATANASSSLRHESSAQLQKLKSANTAGHQATDKASEDQLRSTTSDSHTPADKVWHTHCFQLLLFHNFGSS